MRNKATEMLFAGAVCAAVFAFSMQQPCIAEEVPAYRISELHYVELPNAIKQVASQPVLTRAVVEKSAEDAGGTVIVKPDVIVHPNLAGLGGAFNEQGGEAFMSLPEAARTNVANALFNPETGAGLSLCRTAIGSSDFGLGAYSYSEKADDYKMEHFSIERDTTSVIPFILAAKEANPALRIFASPWSPPGWMKLSGKMDGGDQSREMNRLKDDPKIYRAYALYFSNYVQAYGRHGIEIERVVVQNETDMSPKYPGCNMLPGQMAELVSDYMRPQFEKDDLETEIWAGSFRGVPHQDGARNDAMAFMKLEGHEDVDGLGMQYCNDNIMKQLRTTYPELHLMHTEGNCFNGENAAWQARSRFQEVADWLYNGCENFCYWNMVLNEEGKSGWGWKQNSLMRIDRETQAVTYTPDFAAIALLSRFIRPGDQLLQADVDQAKTIAVQNAERLVVFLQNDQDQVIERNIDIAGQQVAVELPAQALCAFVFNRSL